ncbi:hypothetical protein [Hymenobacter sp. BRD67]|uniref:hypothetical protein n=1 Tax=Hymenobacter sp. BRD67 TaxID=2675877 RepID=UPI0039773255
MEGGCSIPSFALATLTPAGDVRLHGGLISLSGEEYIDVVQTAPPRRPKAWAWPWPTTCWLTVAPPSWPASASTGASSRGC